MMLVPTTLYTPYNSTMPANIKFRDQLVVHGLRHGPTVIKPKLKSSMCVYFRLFCVSQEKRNEHHPVETLFSVRWECAIGAVVRRLKNTPALRSGAVVYR